MSSKITFFSFMREVIGQLQQLGKVRTAETYTSTLQSFTTFRGGKDLSVRGITLEQMLHLH